MFSVFDCQTHARLSDRSYSTASEANHDYHMNTGHTYVAPLPELVRMDQPACSTVLLVDCNSVITILFQGNPATAQGFAHGYSRALGLGTPRVMRAGRGDARKIYAASLEAL